jgi:hypothetical protein
VSFPRRCQSVFAVSGVLLPKGRFYTLSHQLVDFDSYINSSSRSSHKGNPF